MLRRYQIVRSRLNQGLDAGILGFALALAYLVRASFPWGDLPKIEPFRDYAWILLLVCPIGPLVLTGQGFYDRPLVPNRLATARSLLRGVVTLTLGIIVLLFVLRLQLARSVIMLTGGFGFVLILAKEEIFRSIATTTFGRDRFKRRLVLAGAAADNVRVREDVAELYPGSIEIVREFELGVRPLSELIEVLHETSAHGVVFNPRLEHLPVVQEAIQLCEAEGVEGVLLTTFLATKVSQATPDMFLGTPVLVYSSTPANHWTLLVKNLVDVLGALFLLVLTSPLLGVVALAIKATSRGPVFFLQRRAGLNGRPFTMIKFRTMVVDAEARKQALSARNEMTGPVFKVTNDPRLTRIGRCLRRHSLDEFPQLLNVLRGEMSLVGPRPLPIEEVARFDDRTHRRRLSVRPGLTGLWQISGRSAISDFREWVRLDLQYIDNWSLWLDCKILLLTVPAVVLGRGAK